MMGKKEDKKIKATSINEDFFKQLVNFSSDDEEKPICIMGPDRSANKNKFRIYAYGGRIASIPFSKNGHIQLADSGYSEYVDNNDDKKVLEQKNIFEDKYWQVIISAAKKKFSNNKGTNKAERRIETELIKHSIANADKNGFIACDMEYSLFSYKDEKSGKNHTPRFDLVLVNSNRSNNMVYIRFIELKCNENACYGKTDIKHHANDMYNLLNNKLAETNEKNSLINQIIEVVRRYNILCNKGIINREAIEWTKNPNFISSAGILYIPDGSNPVLKKEDFTDICRKQLESLDNKNLYFQFAEKPEDVDFDSMQTWDEFIK